MFFLNDCIIWKSNCRHFVAIVADKSAEVKMVCDLCEFNRVAEYTHMLTSACWCVLTLLLYMLCMLDTVFVPYPLLWMLHIASAPDVMAI